MTSHISAVHRHLAARAWMLDRVEVKRVGPHVVSVIMRVDSTGSGMGTGADCVEEFVFDSSFDLNRMSRCLDSLYQRVMQKAEARKQGREELP